MLEIKKSSIAFDEKGLINLEQITTDKDETETFQSLKRAVYNKIAKGQQNRLKSHLDTEGDSVRGFKNG